MSVVLGRDFGPRLCSVLGLDPEHITRLVIDILPSEVVTVTATYTLQEEVDDDLLWLLKTYELHAKED